MTFREKLHMEHPELVKEDVDGYEILCPDEYGYEEVSPCNSLDGNCIKCWNREMPNTELKKEVDAADYIEIYTDGHKKGYEEGLNDAWELLKKLCTMSANDMIGIFGLNYSALTIVGNYTPQEAIAKLKAYEEAQSKIEVGDVVEAYEKIFVVANITRTEDATTYFGIARDGMFMCSEDVKKTGKHIDIKSILKQIGE